MTMRALRLIFAAVAAATLAGCVSYDDHYYAGERGYYRGSDGYYYRDDGRRYGDDRYRSSGSGHGDYWYGSTPGYYDAPSLYESTYYYRVLRPVYAWTWDPWYAPGWYYGVTYFPSRRYTSSWYVGWYSRPRVHYYSPWRHSWADNWYDWSGGYYGYGGYGYGWGYSRRDHDRDRWRRSYVDGYRHTYRDQYSSPRFGSAYNEAAWLSEARQPGAGDYGRDAYRDGTATRDRGPGRGPDGYDGGRVQRWAPAPGSGTVGGTDQPRWTDGGRDYGSDAGRGEAERPTGGGRWAGDDDRGSDWRDASAERGYGKPVDAPVETPSYGEPEQPGRRWAGGEGRDHETTQPIEAERPSDRWAGESRDYETVQPVEPAAQDDSVARDGSRWEDQDARDALYRDSGAGREAAYTDPEPERGWRDDGRVTESRESTPRFEEPRYEEPSYDERRSARFEERREEPRWEPAPVEEPRWQAREEPRYEAREEPRYEVRDEPRFEAQEQPRFEPREEPRFEPREEPRFEAPSFDPPSRDDGGRVERFDHGGGEQPY
jgi:hypothetical protein